MKVGDTIKIHGKHVVKIVSLHKNGKRLNVTGDTYTGYVNVTAAKAI